MPSTVTPSRVVARPNQGLTNGKYGPQRTPAQDEGLSAPMPVAGAAPYERLLRIRDVLDIVGLSRAHVYNLIKQGLFPRPVALGSNCARWVETEVQAWVGASIVAARLTPAERKSRNTESH